MPARRKTPSHLPVSDNSSRAEGGISVTLPPAFQPLFAPARYKVFYGGRGGGKSYSIGIAAILDAYTQKHLWLCTREYQNSIKDSVYQMLIDTLHRLGLKDYFRYTRDEIVCPHSGSRFIFKGLHHNTQEIKSLEGVDRCWIEEAQNMSHMSLEILLPTIRRPGSEFWFSFNPCDETDAVYQKFIENKNIDNFQPPPGTICVKVNWSDNPYFPDVLDEQRRYDYSMDSAKYAWIWGGECRGLDELAIFRNVVVEGFDSPPINEGGPYSRIRDNTRWYFGADWGFSQDPSTLIRSFVRDGNLYVDAEAYGMHVELDDIADFWKQIPGATNHRIYADSARPETISHMRKKGFDCLPCAKYNGSVEDGIAYLQNFKKIVVHPRCKHMAEEARLYRWKVIKTTESISRVPEDRNDHCWDACRYGHDENIRHKHRGLNISASTVKAFYQGM